MAQKLRPQKAKLQKLKLQKVKDKKAYYFFTHSNDEVYIGDPKSVYFKPQFLLKRWSDECYIKLLMETAVTQLKFDEENNYITWESDWFTVKVYPINKRKITIKNGNREYIFLQNEYGGLEFEIILKRKPPTNIFSFRIQTKGLKFYYQPPLTEEFNKQECEVWSETYVKTKSGAEYFRPENVVGSYAVYHATKKPWHKSKEEAEKYKTGKAFHIYRPKAIDSDGNEVWCDLDIKNGFLTIVVPQEFLNKASYPINIDPTFGCDTVGGSSSVVSDNNHYNANQFTIPEDGTAVSISFYLAKDPNGQPDLWFIIYSDNNGYPDTKIDQSNELSSFSETTPQWVTLDMQTGATLNANSKYWLTYLSETNTNNNAAVQYYFDWSGGSFPYTFPISFGGGTRYYKVINHNSPANVFPTEGSSSTRLVSVYCTYSLPETGWLNGWSKRIKITIDHTKVDETLTDFPILLYLSANSGINGADVTCIFDEIGSNRKKIAVTTSDGETQCYVEIEKWDAVNKEAWLWVKVPSISATEDTILYIYYDNSQPDNTSYVGDIGETPAQQVWSNHFVAVYHLNKDPSGSAPQEIDSTGNGHDGTSQGSMTSGDLVNGKVDGALDFDGSNDMIEIPDHPDLEGFSEATFEAWIKMDANDKDRYIICKQDAHTLSGTYKILFDYKAYVSGRNKVISIWGSNVRVEGLTENLAIGTWYYVVGWTDGSTTKIFLNGVEDGSKSGNAFDETDSETVKIGGGESNYHDGIIDEVRISNVARSPAWIKATYETVNDNFVNWGSEQTSGPTEITIIDSAVGQEAVSRPCREMSFTEVATGDEVISRPRREIPIVELATGSEVISRPKREMILAELATGTEIIFRPRREMVIVEIATGIEDISRSRREIVLSELAIGTEVVSRPRKEMILSEVAVGTEIISRPRREIVFSEVATGSENIFRPKREIPITELAIGTEVISRSREMLLAESAVGQEVISRPRREMMLSELATGTEDISRSREISIIELAIGQEIISRPKREMVLNELAIGGEVVSRPKREIPIIEMATGMEIISRSRREIIFTESATGIETIYRPRREISIVELASGQETVSRPRREMIIVESAVGQETLEKIRQLLVSDVGVGEDTIEKIRQILIADVGTGEELLQKLREIVIIEVATGTEEVGKTRCLLVTDIASGTEELSKTRYLLISDVGIGSEIIGKTRYLLMSDIGVGSEIIGKTRYLMVSDIGFAQESLLKARQLLVTDIAEGIENISKSPLIFISDSAIGTELVSRPFRNMMIIEGALGEEILTFEVPTPTVIVGFVPQKAIQKLLIKRYSRTILNVPLSLTVCKLRQIKKEDEISIISRREISKKSMLSRSIKILCDEEVFERIRVFARDEWQIKKGLTTEFSPEELIEREKQKRKKRAQKILELLDIFLRLSEED